MPLTKHRNLLKNWSKEAEILIVTKGLKMVITSSKVAT